MVAGAGSGKTTSLITALDFLRAKYASNLRQNGQRIACITYTKRAVEVISSRLGHDDLYHVSTLHSFLWGEIKRFNRDIKEAIREYRIPQQIEKAQEKDTGKATKEAIKARAQVVQLQESLAALEDVEAFKYDDSSFSDYQNGLLSHDDVIEVATYLLAAKPVFRKVLGFRFPYIFVDEAQDTFEGIVSGLNLTCGEKGLPVVGYFGDPWQQIYYDNRAGEFEAPPQGDTITKTENFRCSESVVSFLNSFRADIEQYAAGENRGNQGSVLITLVQAEDPEAPRKRYSEPQLERALQRLDAVMADWGWSDRDDVIKLFLVRQMIARRLGFSDLHKLFTGQFASSRAQDDYETGEHFLLKPFVRTICPLLAANQCGDNKSVIAILRQNSPAFDIHGVNSRQPLHEMIKKSNTIMHDLSRLWEGGTMREVLNFCRGQSIIRFPDRLLEHLSRRPRSEDYDSNVHEEEKGDWLCDQFFEMGTAELHAYCDFIEENTAYSTQHGVKGEEYPNVLVVFDDIEAAWTQFSFTKLLTPKTAGEPTDGQFERSRKLAYVCFSRAEENLRILLFTPNPEAAKRELIESRLLLDEQINIAI